MSLTKNKDYYVAKTSIVLRETGAKKAKPLNHLLFGDWLRFLGEEKNGWVRVKCRGDTGWIRRTELQPERPIEINFLDIGQGDSCHVVMPDDTVLLIDGGKTNNLYRFLNWRYNLRNRKVKGVDGIPAGDTKAKDPVHIHNVVITHPDEDHYGGFRDVFAYEKLSVGNIYHNGLVERPISDAERAAIKRSLEFKFYSSDDLGRYTTDKSQPVCVWDIVDTDTQLRKLVSQHANTRKRYIPTLKAAIDNPSSKDVKFKALSTDDVFLPGFEADADVSMELLGPVRDDVIVGGKTKSCLRRLGSEGVTKNGHSVVFKLSIGKLKVLLGGDLNTEAEDYLLHHYTKIPGDASDYEKTAYKLRAKGKTLDEEDAQKLAEAEAMLEAITKKGRGTFQVDVAKACHHGSHHFSEVFLKAVNAIAVVISSGDQEKYAHPRPDALGAFGKYGRGNRPLIFSTEIARSTREFTPLFKYFEKLKAYEADLANAATDAAKKKVETKMENAKDRNVAVYGMITLRSDGDTTILAQKLELPDSDDNKWDIHQLEFNQAQGEFEYRDETKHH